MDQRPVSLSNIRSSIAKCLTHQARSGRLPAKDCRLGKHAAAHSNVFDCAAPRPLIQCRSFLRAAHKKSLWQPFNKVIGQPFSFQIAALEPEGCCESGIKSYLSNPSFQGDGRLGPEWIRRTETCSRIMCPKRGPRTRWAVRFPLGAFGNAATNHCLLQP
jgi:hypothetical protein